MSWIGGWLGVYIRKFGADVVAVQHLLPTRLRLQDSQATLFFTVQHTVQDIVFFCELDAYRTIFILSFLKMVGAKYKSLSKARGKRVSSRTLRLLKALPITVQWHFSFLENNPHTVNHLCSWNEIKTFRKPGKVLVFGHTLSILHFEDMAVFNSGGDSWWNG